MRMKVIISSDASALPKRGPGEDGSQHPKPELYYGHYQPRNDNDKPPNPAGGVHLLDSAIRGATVNRPGAKLAYVAVVPVGNLYKRPVLAQIVLVGAFAPAAKADGAPQVAFTRRIHDQAIQPRHTQTLSAAALQDGVWPAVPGELPADDVGGDDLAIQRTGLPQRDHARQVEVRDDEELELERQGGQPCLSGVSCLRRRIVVRMVVRGRAAATATAAPRPCVSDGVGGSADAAAGELDVVRCAHDAVDRHGVPR
ncbi:hypothetical protein AAE478_005776 [Parahypoxylon ruwenzoriense]